MGFFSITVKKNIRTLTRLSCYNVIVPNLVKPLSTGKSCYDITSIGTSTKMILHSHLLGLCFNANVYILVYILYSNKSKMVQSGRKRSQRIFF